MPVNTNGTARGGATRRGRGGARGGAQTKAGPRPARHIPWPEIFRHHISLVEGHLKMIDMVRKHTIEGSGNNRTIQNLIDRAQTMLRDAKSVQREFVPPKDAWQKVPIGSSSDTMYPGYSPKDHEYGKAAQEFGKQWSEARKHGIEFDAGPDGPEYQFGQNKAQKKRRLNDSAAESAADDSRTSDKGANESTAAPQNTDSNPLFFFDSNPTPVNALGNFIKANHPNADSTSESESTSKKTKTSRKTEAAATTSTTEHTKPVIEYENIDREVDARLKLRADAEKNKKDKKRKRESAASTDIPLETEVLEEQSSEKRAKSKKKKKSKAQESTEEPRESIDTEMEDAPLESESKDDAKADTEHVDSNSETPKRAKKSQSSGDDVDTDRKKKKQKKNKHKD